MLTVSFDALSVKLASTKSKSKIKMMKDDDVKDAVSLLGRLRVGCLVGMRKQHEAMQHSLHASLCKYQVVSYATSISYHDFDQQKPPITASSCI